MPPKKLPPALRKAAEKEEQERARERDKPIQALWATLGQKDIARALAREAQALQKIHHSVRLSVQKLEVEEAVIKQMIRRERRKQAAAQAPQEQQACCTGESQQQHQTG